MAKKLVERVRVDQLLSFLKIVAGFEVESLQAAERPDFVGATSRGTLGIETTIGSDEEYIRGKTLQREQFPNSWINITGLIDGDKRRGNQELQAEMWNLSGKWLPFAETWKHHVEKIASIVTDKRSSFRKPDFQKFDANWLLIYDETHLIQDLVTPSVQRNTVSAAFSQAGDSAMPDFDYIFFLSEPFLFRYAHGSLFLVTRR